MEADDLRAAARTVLDRTRSRRPTLGAGRLVGVDGPAGSGKTTLAAHLATLAPAARVVHLDDLYDGWSGLAGVGAQLADLLRPLARGEAGTYRHHDWAVGAATRTVVVEPVDLLVVEGVGAGAPGVADLVTLLVWVSAPSDLRLARGLARDGEHLRPQWEQWRRDETRLHARERTRERADLRVDGSGSDAPRVGP